TAMGCPASEFILDDVRERLLREPGIDEVRVNVVWDPPWTTGRMTQAGRDVLEAWGLAVGARTATSASAGTPWSTRSSRARRASIRVIWSAASSRLTPSWRWSTPGPP